MVPKVSDLHVNAIGRVLLAPLVGEIPGFGAAVISLRYTPAQLVILAYGCVALRPCSLLTCTSSSIAQRYSPTVIVVLSTVQI